MMTDWYVAQRGFTELQQSFKTAPSKIQEIRKAWLREVAEAQRNMIQSHTPVKTGKLISTIKADTKGGYTAQVKFSPLLPYTKPIEFGTGIYGPKHKPIHIEARKAQALHFWWKGKEWFRKSVNVKGYKGAHMVAKGIKDFDKRAKSYYRELEQRIAAVLKGE